ncbi:unnamed protein product, partial [Rotaria magnacalcarata]
QQQQPSYQYPQQQYPQQNYNNYNNNHYNNNTNNLPALLNLNPSHLPPQQHTRSFQHAQQYNPNQQHQHYPRPMSRSRFHVLSQLPSRSRSRSPYRPIPPPTKPRRTYLQQQQRPQYN